MPLALRALAGQAPGVRWMVSWLGISAEARTARLRIEIAADPSIYLRIGRIASDAPVCPNRPLPGFLPAEFPPVFRRFAVAAGEAPAKRLCFSVCVRALLARVGALGWPCVLRPESGLQLDLVLPCWIYPVLIYKKIGHFPSTRSATW